MKEHKKRISERTVVTLYIGITILLLAGAVVFSIGHDKGYRIKGFSIQQVGSLSMIVDEKNAWVFIGEKPVYKTKTTEEAITIPNVEPGLQLVTVIKDRYFPWAKRIRIPSGNNLELYPFLLPQSLEAEEVTMGDTNFFELYQYFRAPENTLFNSFENNGKIVSVSEAGVVIRENGETKTITTFDPVQEVVPFKDNPNVVIYTTPTQVWVTELEEKDPLSYQIFEGKNIRIYPKENTLFIKSAENYYRINL